METKILISDEEIYKLRKKGLSYKKIEKYFDDKGIIVTAQTIRNKCKKIYKDKGEKEPELIVKRSIPISDEKIYTLREQELSYEKIAQYFKGKGIKVSPTTIEKRCKEIYKDKGKKEPKLRVERKNPIPDEEIYELRKKGLSYKKIGENLNNKGIKISPATIRKKCKEIYKEKGEKEPELMPERENNEQIPEKIYQLREKGLTYQRIAKYFNKEGVKVSVGTIRRKCQKIYKDKGEEEPKAIPKKRIQISDKKIYQLREQGLSYQKIAKYFNEKGIKVSFETIRTICKRIYQEKTNDYKNKKLDKTSLDDLEKKVQELKEKKEESGELLKEYIKLEKKYKQQEKQKEKDGEEK